MTPTTPYPDWEYYGKDLFSWNKWTSEKINEVKRHTQDLLGSEKIKTVEDLMRAWLRFSETRKTTQNNMHEIFILFSDKYHEEFKLIFPENTPLEKLQRPLPKTLEALMKYQSATDIDIAEWGEEIHGALDDEAA